MYCISAWITAPLHCSMAIPTGRPPNRCRSWAGSDSFPPKIGFLTNGAQKRYTPSKTGLPYRWYESRTNGPYTGASTPRVTRARPPRLCVHVSSALVVRPLDASRHQHIDGNRRPDRVPGTVKARLSRSALLRTTGPGQRVRRAFAGGSYASWATKCCGRHVVRIPLYSVAVAVLWRPTFKEPPSAMTQPRSEHLTRRIRKAGDAWTHSFA